MDTAFQIAGDPDSLLALLVPIDDKGHLQFGFSGRSEAPSDYTDLLSGSVLIIDYLMEGFVPYFLSAERTAEGLRLAVKKTGTNRDWAVDRSVEKYIESKGLTAIKYPAEPPPISPPKPP